MLEYAARNAQRFGGLAALAGALVGDDAEMLDRMWVISRAPRFCWCAVTTISTRHIPEAKVRKAATMLAAQGAAIDLRIYPGITHTIVGDQIEALRGMVDTVRAGIAVG